MRNLCACTLKGVTSPGVSRRVRILTVYTDSPLLVPAGVEYMINILLNRIRTLGVQVV